MSKSNETPLMTTKYEADLGEGETLWKCPSGHWRTHSSVRLGTWRLGPYGARYPECPDCRAALSARAAAAGKEEA